MQEQTSTKKNGSELLTNGIDSDHAALAGQEHSGRGGAGNLAAAIEKLVQYLDDSERAKSRSGAVPHHRVVDLASLRDWLEHPESRGLGETPRGEPVAGREENRGGVTDARHSKTRRRNEPATASPAARPVQPARVFVNGNVTTKVWANRDASGHLTWSVQLLRGYPTAEGLGQARSFRPDDLRDAMRGAYQAERWIRKNERRYRLLGWFLGY